MLTPFAVLDDEALANEVLAVLTEVDGGALANDVLTALTEVDPLVVLITFPGVVEDDRGSTGSQMKLTTLLLKSDRNQALLSPLAT